MCGLGRLLFVDVDADEGLCAVADTSSRRALALVVKLTLLVSRCAYLTDTQSYADLTHQP